MGCKHAGGLGCGCQDVLVFCLQVVDVVATSYTAAGRVPLAGQAPGDLTAGGTSAVRRVHEAGQETGHPAASSPFPLEQVQGTLLASNSPAEVPPTSRESAGRAASSNGAAVEAFQAVQPPEGVAPTSNPAPAEGCHPVQSCHRESPAGQANSSNPTEVGNLADGHQPARLAASQAAQDGLVPSTWPMYGIASGRHAIAQVGLICAVCRQAALCATPITACRPPGVTFTLHICLVLPTS